MGLTGIDEDIDYGEGGLQAYTTLTNIRDIMELAKQELASEALRNRK